MASEFGANYFILYLQCACDPKVSDETFIYGRGRQAAEKAHSSLVNAI